MRRITQGFLKNFSGIPGYQKIVPVDMDFQLSQHHPRLPDKTNYLYFKTDHEKIILLLLLVWLLRTVYCL